MNSSVKQSKKRLLYERQRGRCHYCGNPFTIAQLTFDHVLRRKDGGTSTITNLVLACRPCNQYREMADASPEAKQRFLKRHTHYIHTGHLR